MKTIKNTLRNSLIRIYYIFFIKNVCKGEMRCVVLKGHKTIMTVDKKILCFSQVRANDVLRLSNCSRKV